MIEIICIRGNGDKEMDPIDDPLINTDFMATKRGKYEIDRQWFLAHLQNIEVPFKKRDSGSRLLDNDIITVSDGYFGITGERRVKKINIEGNASNLTMRLEIAKYEEFI